MVEYTKVNVKLLDSQIKKLKDAVKNNTGKCLMEMIYHMNYSDNKTKYKNKKCF